MLDWVGKVDSRARELAAQVGHAELEAAQPEEVRASPRFSSSGPLPAVRSRDAHAQRPTASERAYGVGAASRGHQPILDTITPDEEKQRRKVPLEVLDRAQAQLDAGDRGGAYLTLYRELGSEQILIQAQITTYTGVWGSGALTGNALAKQSGGARYNLQLDQFSTEIAQATIDAIRKDLAAGGTGRLNEDQFQSADRGVWAKKGMPELFPGNVQFLDFWDHQEGDRADALFTPSVWNMAKAALRSLVPNTSLFGLNQDGRNVANLVGKRPAEYEGNPNYTIHGGADDRFITVIDNRTGFVEAFWDNHPHVGPIPMPQLDNRPIDPESTEYRQRQQFYEYLGANKAGRSR